MNQQLKLWPHLKGWLLWLPWLLVNSQQRSWRWLKDNSKTCTGCVVHRYSCLPLTLNLAPPSLSLSLSVSFALAFFWHHLHNSNMGFSRRQFLCGHIEPYRFHMPQSTCHIRFAIYINKIVVSFIFVSSLVPAVVVACQPKLRPFDFGNYSAFLCNNFLCPLSTVTFCLPHQPACISQLVWFMAVLSFFLSMYTRISISVSSCHLRANYVLGLDKLTIACTGWWFINIAKSICAPHTHTQTHSVACIGCIFRLCELSHLFIVFASHLRHNFSILSSFFFFIWQVESFAWLSI